MTYSFELNDAQSKRLASSSMLDIAHVLEDTAEFVFTNGGARAVGLSILTREAENRLVRQGQLSHETYASQSAALLLLDLYTPAYNFYTTKTCVNALLLAAAEARYRHSTIRN